MTLEGECQACGLMDDENAHCSDHELFVSENDDNCETLMAIITQAREFCGVDK